MTPPASATVRPLQPFAPDLYERAWCSVPHPTLPLLATAHAKSVTVFSLSTLTVHSRLTGGHQRSVRSAAWKPGLPPHKLCLVTGSFDSTAGLWRWDGDVPGGCGTSESLEVEVTSSPRRPRRRTDDADSDAGGNDGDEEDEDEDKDWEFTLVLEGHDSEIKAAAFSPSGAHLATCSRDKSVWIWEDVGTSEADDEWETVAVLSEHDGDVKAVAWCPDVPGRNQRRRYSSDVLASASYDNTVRIWREDGDGEWVCVAVLEGHGGTVWGLQWEPSPKAERFPRLATFSADNTIRVWTLKEEEDDEDVRPSAGGFAGRLGGIPNTMRRSPREDWECTAVLPRIHTRDVYSVTWSATSGLLASTGSDGIIAIYCEDDDEAASSAAKGGDVEAMDVDQEEPMVTNGASDAEQPPQPTTTELPGSKRWRLLTTVPNAHGPYEINHVAWCRRYDPSAERRGIEEMLVSTGDDGLIRSWQVVLDD